MTSRERMLTALANGRPDRLPARSTVDGLLPQHNLGGMDWCRLPSASAHFAIYVEPEYEYAGATVTTACPAPELGRWRREARWQTR